MGRAGEGAGTTAGAGTVRVGAGAGPQADHNKKPAAIETLRMQPCTKKKSMSKGESYRALRPWYIGGMLVRLLKGRGPLLALLVTACAEEPTSRSDAGLDASLLDAEPTTDAGHDSGPRVLDEPPSCEETEPTVTTVAPKLAGEFRGPSVLSLSPDGSSVTLGYTDTTRLPQSDSLVSVTVDPSGAIIDTHVIATTTDQTRLTNPQLIFEDKAFRWIWAETESDDKGAFAASRIMTATQPTGGVPSRSTLIRDNAGSPFVAHASGNTFLVWSDILTLGSGGLVGIRPQLGRVVDGSLLLPTTDLSANLGADALDLQVGATGSTLMLAWRVAPSTGRLAIFTAEGLLQTLRVVTGITRLDAAALLEEEQAVMSWSEQGSGTAAVGGRLTSLDEFSVNSVDLESEITETTDARSTVLAVWPGMLFVWRTGAGADATLRAAGADLDGRLRVGPVDLAGVPGSTGPLHIAAHDGEIFVATRSGDAISLVRACVPR